jgi:hypothetical protein
LLWTRKEEARISKKSEGVDSGGERELPRPQDPNWKGPSEFYVFLLLGMPAKEQCWQGFVHVVKDSSTKKLNNNSRKTQRALALEENGYLPPLKKANFEMQVYDSAVNGYQARISERALKLEELKLLCELEPDNAKYKEEFIAFLKEPRLVAPKQPVVVDLTCPHSSRSGTSISTATGVTSSLGSATLGSASSFSSTHALNTPTGLLLPNEVFEEEE